MPDDRRNHGRQRRKPMPKGGRKPKNPFGLEPLIDRYLIRARAEGTTTCPLDFKTVARWIRDEGKEEGVQCSHTHFSPKAIESAPPEYRDKWAELRQRILDTKEEIEGRRRTAMDRQQEEIERLQAELKQLRKQNEQLWIWMIQIEAGLQRSGIEVEMYVPDDLRYGREERRPTAPD